MKIQTINVGLSKFERETTINIVFENESDMVGDRKVIIDTTVLADYNTLKSRGWKQTDEYRYADGTVCGGAFEGPVNALTFRGINSLRKTNMTDEQRKAASERMKKMRKKQIHDSSN